MRAAVILFPGSNREGDVARALHQASGVKPPIVWHDERELPAGTDLVVLPGGFSYGDYLRCGAIAARAQIMDAVRAHAARGGLVLGVCNGFQILCEGGLLPGVLMRNADLRFICRMQHLARRERSDPLFPRLRAGARSSRSRSPMARAIMSPTPPRSQRWKARAASPSAIATPRGGSAAPPIPTARINDIAGIYSERFNVLGLMPHPENLIDPLVGGVDGRGHVREPDGGLRRDKVAANVVLTILGLDVLEITK